MRTHGNRSWTRRPASLICSVGLCVLTYGAAGCGYVRTVRPPPGLVYGTVEASEGRYAVEFLSLKDRKWASLFFPENKPGQPRIEFTNFRRACVVDCATSTVFVTVWDGHRYGVAEWRFDEKGSSPRIVYSVPRNGGYIRWMILAQDGKRLFFLLEPDAESYGSVLLVYDRLTGSCASAFGEKSEVRLAGSPRPVWAEDKRLLVYAYLKKAGARRRRRGATCLLDCRTGALTNLGIPFAPNSFAEGGRFLLSVDYGSKSDSFRLFDRELKKFVAKVRERDLPGIWDYGEVDLVGTKHMLVSRERGAWWYLGTFLVNLETGKYAKVGEGMRGAYYLNECPLELNWRRRQ